MTIFRQFVENGLDLKVFINFHSIRLASNHVAAEPVKTDSLAQFRAKKK